MLDPSARRRLALLHTGEYDRPEVTDAVVAGIIRDLHQHTPKVRTRSDEACETGADSHRDPRKMTHIAGTRGREGAPLYPRLIQGGQGRTDEQLVGDAGSLAIIWIVGANLLGLIAVIWCLDRLF